MGYPYKKITTADLHPLDGFVHCAEEVDTIGTLNVSISIKIVSRLDNFTDLVLEHVTTL